MIYMLKRMKRSDLNIKTITEDSVAERRLSQLYIQSLLYKKYYCMTQFQEADKLITVINIICLLTLHLPETGDSVSNSRNISYYAYINSIVFLKIFCTNKSENIEWRGRHGSTRFYLSFSFIVSHFCLSTQKNMNFSCFTPIQFHPSIIFLTEW